MTLAVYHEARGEPLEGQYAVAHVIMNRVKDRRWPDTVCGVIGQKSQFTFADNHSIPKDEDALSQAMIVSRLVLNGRPDSSLGATHYFNPDKANPAWAGVFTYIQRLGNHVFYK